MEIFLPKLLVVGKLGLFSGMYNDALMHREDLKGYSDPCSFQNNPRSWKSDHRDPLHFTTIQLKLVIHSRWYAVSTPITIQFIYIQQVTCIPTISVTSAVLSGYTIDNYFKTWTIQNILQIIQKWWQEYSVDMHIMYMCYKFFNSKIMQTQNRVNEAYEWRRKISEQKA